MMVAFMDQPFAGAFTSEATRTPVRTKSNPRTRRTETRSFIGGTSPRENVDAGGVLRPPRNDPVEPRSTDRRSSLRREQEAYTGDRPFPEFFWHRAAGITRSSGLIYGGQWWRSRLSEAVDIPFARSSIGFLGP